MRKISSTNYINENLASNACPIFRSTRLIAPRWRTHILWQLRQSEMRFGELRAAIPLATERMIALRLRELSEDGLIETRARADQKYYALTDRGSRLIPVLESLLRIDAGP